MQELASVIDRKLASSKSKERTFITYLKEGEKPNKVVMTSGVLDLAKDWVLKADIHEKLVIPEDIVKTKQRPDIVMSSRSRKTITLVELHGNKCWKRPMKGKG